MISQKWIKILAGLLIIFSLTPYLEWSGNNKAFLFELEFTVLKQLFTNPQNMLHPLILLPLSGQILLLIYLFRKIHKTLLYIAIACLGLLILLMFFVGLLTMNFKIILSALPFILTAITTLVFLKRQPKKL